VSAALACGLVVHDVTVRRRTAPGLEVLIAASLAPFLVRRRSSPSVPPSNRQRTVSALSASTATIPYGRPSAGPDNRVPDSNASRSGCTLVPLRGTIIDTEVRLDPPRLEPLTVAQEAEATELLAALLASAASRSAEHSPRCRRRRNGSARSG
jgi:hypothetical protein